MSNLTPDGVKFIVDDSQAGPAFQRLDKAVGANAQTLRLFASSALSAAGGGSQLLGVVGALVAGVGVVDIALLAVGATIAIAKQKFDENTESVKSQEQALANLISDYETFIALRNRLQSTPQAQVANFPTTVSTFATSEFDTLNARTSAASKNLGQAAGYAIALGINEAFGLHQDEIAKNFEDDLRAALRAAAGNLNPFDILQEGQQAARDKLARTQTATATAEFVTGAANRTAAAALQDEINKMAEAGATADALIPKLAALAAAQGRVVNGAQLQGQANDLVSSAATGAYEARQAKIEAFNQQIVDVELAGFAQSEQLAADHQDTLTKIGASGLDARLRIERGYSRQLRDIGQNERDADVQAATARAESIANAEEAINKQRSQNATTYADQQVKIDVAAADQRLKTEQDYQDAIKRITQDYALSYFEASSHNDARALIAARMQRDTQLSQAKQTRDRSNQDTESARVKDQAAAKNDYVKQQKALDDNLRTQKAQIEKSYADAIRRAAEAAAKARASAREARADQLADQLSGQRQQEAAETDSYRKRQAAIDAAEVVRIASIKAAMEKEVGVTRDYLQEIGDSIKTLLDPDAISAKINEIQKAIKARIDVLITPFHEGGNTGKGFAAGGFTAGYTGLATVHPEELILPLRNAARTQQLVRQYLNPRMLAAYGGSSGAMGGATRGQIKVTLDSPLLHATVEQIAGDLDIQVEEAFAAGGN